MDDINIYQQRRGTGLLICLNELLHYSIASCYHMKCRSFKSVDPAEQTMMSTHTVGQITIQVAMMPLVTPSFVNLINGWEIKYTISLNFIFFFFSSGADIHENTSGHNCQARGNSFTSLQSYRQPATCHFLAERKHGGKQDSMSCTSLGKLKNGKLIVWG